MQGRYKAYQRNLGSSLESLIRKGQSALILGPRQTGKTTLVIETYRKLVKRAFVVTTGRLPEKLNDMITVVPWRYL